MTTLNQNNETKAATRVAAIKATYAAYAAALVPTDPATDDPKVTYKGTGVFCDVHPTVELLDDFRRPTLQSDPPRRYVRCLVCDETYSLVVDA